MEFNARNVLPDPIMLEDNDDDEWYYDSIARFHQLQMFDFESPISHVDFSENDHICVAGKIRGDQQEIQELSVPEKSSLSAFESHDLKMKTGGFSVKPVFQMKCLRNQRKLVLSEYSLKGVSVYQLGCDKSDYIKKVGELSSDIQNPRLAVFGNRVFYGSSTSNIHVADAELDKAHLIIPPDGSHTSDAEISDLCSWSENCVGYCESLTGKVTLLDCRSLNRKTFSPFPYEVTGDTCARHSVSVQEGGKLIGVMSNNGHINIFDIRGESESPVIKVDVCTDSLPECKGSPLILFSPHQSCMFSVSSVSGGVSVYRLQGSVAKLVFSYDGHSRNHSRTNVFITNHIWSPANENMLYSSASDGSFHCWQFIENK